MTGPGRGTPLLERLPSRLWVVPSERHVERWSRHVSQGRVETRERLRTRLFDQLVRDRGAATLTETRLALAEALAATAEEDPLLRALARAKGGAWERTLDAVDGAIAVLRASGVRGEALARAAEGAAGARGRTLAAAMRGLDAALEARKLIDPRAVAGVLAERIPAHPPGRVLEVVGARAVVARFVLAWDGADAAWWRALDAALVRAGGEGTRAELPSYDEAIDPSRERGPVDVVTEDVARALDAPPVGLVMEAPLGDLRLMGAVPARTKEAVDLRVAIDAEAQARAVLDVVRRALMAGAGVEEIAITAGRFDEESVGALRVAFDDARVPFHDARGESPLAAGVVAFALRALALGDAAAGAPLSRLDMATTARSGYLDPERLGATAEALDDLAHALERTASSAAATARDALVETARASPPARPGDPATGESRGTLAARIADAALEVARPMTRAEHVAAARRLFDALGIDPLRARGARVALATDEPARDIGRSELGAVARDAHAWDLLQAALGEYEAASARLGLSRATIAPHTFRHELARTLEGRAWRPGSARAGAVRIADLAELAGEPLAVLVVIDANEGALPSRGEGDPLLHDDLTAALRAIDPVRAPPSSAVRAARELTWLALAAAHARSVVFTRRSRDEEGAALAPSPVLAWLERGGLSSTRWRASPLDGPAVTRREARLRRVARGDARREEAAEGDVLRRAHTERARESRFERAVAPVDPILGDLHEGAPLHPELARALLVETGGADRPLAVTSLERFATCPFQGVARQVLRALHERPLREVPDARETGTLIHRALAAAFVATAPLWRERPRDAPRIRTVAAETTDALLRQESVASVLRRLALARVRTAVAAVVEWSLADSAWDFAYAEQSFGDGRSSSWPPLVLDDRASRLSLRGSIDRVDVGHGRAAVRVIDYKTSISAAEGGMRALGQTAFQVPLYAHIAADALAAATREGLYLACNRPGDVGPKLKKDFEAAWQALHASEGPLTAVEARALGLIAKVRLGALAPDPEDETACTRCDSSGGCRKPRFAIPREDDGPPAS